MALFDSLRCYFPLPVPAVQESTFQTKSLGQTMGEYALRADGTLWRHTGRRGNSQKKPAEVLCDDVPDEVEFYAGYGTRGATGLAQGWVKLRARFETNRLARIDVLEHIEPPEVVARSTALTLTTALLPETTGSARPRL